MARQKSTHQAKSLWQVRKVAGGVEDYSQEKVADAIFLAAQDVGGTDKKLAGELAEKVTGYLQAQFGRMGEISTRDIGDAVERILMEEHHIKTARAYIINRDKKREEYEAKIRLGVRDDIGMSLNSLVVMKNKYLIKRQATSHRRQAEEYESPLEAFERVAGALAGAEKGKKLQEKWYEKFLEVMRERRMLPAGRTLANAGTINNQLANCFVMPFPDEIEGIFEVVKESSILKKNGGGVGFTFSKIRPKGDTVATTSGAAAGPVALMGILDHASDIFLQAGGRRSGNMVTLADNHPDIFEFIGCKEGNANLPNINYSLEISDAFMKAVERDEEWELVNPRNGEVAQKVSAQSIMELAARQAWKGGDPGFIFINEINRFNPTPHVDRLNTVNLCGEQPLLSYEACNLGSINLAAHVMAKKGRESTMGDFEIDWEKLTDSVEIGVRMLDNVVSVCTYPIAKVDEVVKGNRKIGLGVMGWADVLVKLGVSYDSDEALKLAEKVMKKIQETAWKTSEALGREKGNFPNFKGSLWQKRGYTHFRNATTTTIAPTGSLSMVADCSGGIEPHFALAFYRKAMGEYELPEVNRDLVVALKRANRVYSYTLMNTIAKSGSIREIEEIPEKIRQVFVTSMDIAPNKHVKMQAAFQKYTDNAVSKTINLPANATVEDVQEAFILAWKTKCKGITVYRDKSREVQVLNIGDKRQATRDKTKNNQREVKTLPLRMSQSVQSHEVSECPECGKEMMMVEGCTTCSYCGYSHCSL